jgi:hypothetical protein
VRLRRWASRIGGGRNDGKGPGVAGVAICRQFDDLSHDFGSGVLGSVFVMAIHLGATGSKQFEDLDPQVDQDVRSTRISGLPDPAFRPKSERFEDLDPQVDQDVRSARIPGLPHPAIRLKSE